MLFVFYDNYVRACELRGEKPTPVAQKVGCTSSNIAQWKKGSTPRSAVLQKIADYLEVSPQYLMLGDDNGNENNSAKKEPAPKKSELSIGQLELIELSSKMSDDELRKFIAAMNAMLGE